MKLLFLSLLLFGASNALPVESEKPILGDMIGDLIAGIVKGVINNIAGKIPDPIAISEMNLDLTLANLTSGHLSISDFSETGCKGFTASNISIITMPSSRLYVVLDIPSVNINTNYDADILLASLIPIYGNGPANININKFRVVLNSSYELALFKKSLKIKDLSVLFSINDATFDVHGAINNEAFSVIISQIMNDVVAPFINNHSERLSKLLSPMLETIINNLLSGNKKLELNDSLSEEINEAELIALMKLYMNSVKNHPKFGELLNF